MIAWLSRVRSLSTTVTREPLGKLRRHSISLLALRRRQVKTCVPGNILTPSLPTMWKKWECSRSSVWVATKVPLPRKHTTSFSSAISAIALRTVPWLTWYWRAKSNSLGSTIPSAHSPVLTRSVIISLICIKRGRRDGDVVFFTINKMASLGVHKEAPKRAYSNNI